MPKRDGPDRTTPTSWSGLGPTSASHMLVVAACQASRLPGTSVKIRREKSVDFGSPSGPKSDQDRASQGMQRGAGPHTV